jgi:hypothetical protein
VVYSHKHAEQVFQLQGEQMMIAQTQKIDPTHRRRDLLGTISAKIGLHGHIYNNHQEFAMLINMRSNIVYACKNLVIWQSCKSPSSHLWYCIAMLVIWC